MQQEIHLDFDRTNRCGFPEAVFGEGKSLDQLDKIARLQMVEHPVFITRISDADATELHRRLNLPAESFRHNPVARTVHIQHQPKAPGSTVTGSESLEGGGFVPVITAGTTDNPVAEEVVETLRWMNVNTSKIMDVGVAGPHRLPERLDELTGADAVVVVAGMEGALPSVVAGYVPCPVIGVPTSVGYGANLAGISALLSMLNSCAANVSVVNIDAGFKGGYVAGLIAHRAAKNNLKSRTP